MKNLKVKKVGNYLKVLNENGEVLMVVSLGNLKVSKRTGIVNLTPGKDGSCFQDCEFCYAKKAEKVFPSARISRKRNFELAKNNPELFFECLGIILDYLVKRNLIDNFRYHESGDFFSQSYLDNCEKMAKNFPSINFYAYSKNFHVLNFDNCKYLHVINSKLPNGMFNFGKKSFIENMAKEYNLPICPCNAENMVKGYCGKDCRICMVDYPTSVLFEVH